MSKIIIRDEKQLINFLNVLAEESVGQAQLSLSGGKAQQQQVSKNIQASKREFIEEEDPPGEQAPAAEPAEPAPAPAPATPSSEPSSISPKFDSLVDAINDLRGAPSSKDTTVETQLRAYYDKLDSAEAASAILFIRTISQVMKGEVEGARAPDPTDYQITTQMKDEEKSAKPEPQVAAPSTPVEAPSSKPAKDNSGEGENTSPPIKVGGTQVTESYRSMIKMLLSKS